MSWVATPLRLTPPSSSPPPAARPAFRGGMRTRGRVRMRTRGRVRMRTRGRVRMRGPRPGVGGDLCCYAGTGVRQLGCNSPRRRGLKIPPTVGWKYDIVLLLLLLLLLL
jgi:hypothetical protein